MVEIKHTPGPWAWDGHVLRPVAAEPHVSAVHTILEVEYLGWGYLCSDHNQTCAENDANQALIAASPDLFDAAVAAERVLARMGWRQDNTFDPEAVALAKLRAALVKATEVRHV
ncbi:hypothetical protein [Burkholderia ubonensis]|uniref:hypothetical protein n=1 Tax=Burkholderia ubonensis TaxID=101571 RepID=UPI000759E503|nr:hypothetical protein [Burkholderia ubonensis]KVD28199.1 hypothetical protein WI83_23625 [Burkholderia ubonensis]